MDRVLSLNSTRQYCDGAAMSSLCVSVSGSWQQELAEACREAFIIPPEKGVSIHEMCLPLFVCIHVAIRLRIIRGIFDEISPNACTSLSACLRLCVSLCV